MADRREVGAVYAAGLVQGVALVTFPAASSILTSPDWYDLSSTAYGSLFLPQAIAAIAAALAGARLAAGRSGQAAVPRRAGRRPAAMTLLFVSQFLIGAGALPYLMLLVATTSLGIGFGLAVPSLNTFAAAFFPERRTGRSCTSTPCWGSGRRWRRCSSPCSSAWGLVGAAAAGRGPGRRADPVRRGAPAPARTRGRRPPGGRRGGLGHPARVLAVRRVRRLLRRRGDDERQLGDAVHDQGSLGASATVASLALTAFWGDGDGGPGPVRGHRAALPGATRTGSCRSWPRPALAAIAFLPGGDPRRAIAAFGLAGLGCSALLPLTISFGQRR